MNSKTSFLLFTDLAEPVNNLSDEDAGQLFKAIFEYEKGEESQGLSSAASVALTFIKQQLDRCDENYERRCAANRQNGLKGGRPTKPKKPTGLSGLSKKPKLTQANPTEPTITLPDPNPDPGPKSDPDKKDNIAPPARNEEKRPLYHSIENLFVEHNEDFDYGREGKHLVELEKKGLAREDPARFMSEMIETFYELTESEDKIFGHQPFLPSILNSGGMWPRVLKAHKRKIEDARIDAELEDIF